MATARTRRQWASEAALQALVRFGPEISGLSELQRTAEQEYKQSVAGARSGAQMISSAVDAARPQVAAAFSQSGLDQARAAHTLVAHDLARLGPVADSIKAGAKLENTVARRHLGEARAAALTDLAQRKVAAASGASFATQAAGRSLAADLEKILSRRQALRRESGAFQALTMSQLRQEAADRALKLRIENLGNANARRVARISANSATRRARISANAAARRQAAQLSQSERNSLRSSGIDPNTGKPIPGGKLDPAVKRKSRQLSPDKHFSFAEDVRSVMSYASRYKGKLSRAAIVRKLSQGRPQQTVYVDAGGNPVAKGTQGARPVVLPKIPAFSPDIKMTAALDVALDGHISRATARKLQQAGFRVRDLGFPTYSDWIKTHRPPRFQQPRGTMAPGYHGQSRPT